MTKLSWFPFYTRDFFNDEKVKLFTLRQIGAYLVLLSHQWDEGSIPPLPLCQVMLTLAHEPDAEVARQEIAVVFKQCFVKHPTLKQRWMNQRLERIRQEKHEKYQSFRRRGSKGGMMNRSSLAQAELQPGSSLAQAELKPGSTTQIQIQTQNKIKKKKRGTELSQPDPWTLTETMTTYAHEKGMTPSTISNEFEACKTHHLESRFTQVGWDRQVWQTWVLRWISFGRKQAEPRPRLLDTSTRHKIEEKDLVGPPPEVLEAISRIGRAIPA